MIQKTFYRYTYIVVLFSLITLIVMVPFLKDNNNNLLFTLLFSFPLIAGIFATFDQKSMKKFGIMLGITALTINIVISWDSETDWVYILRFIILFSFLAYVTFRILKTVVKSREIDFNIIAGAVSVYLILAIKFSFLFTLIYHFDQDAFIVSSGKMDNRDFIYFSLVTMTTLGYGDISPLAPAARSMSMLLVILGQMYLTILIAILVSKFKGWRRLQEQDSHEGDQGGPADNDQR
jgi:voltage-gated potassium channel Kch